MAGHLQLALGVGRGAFPDVWHGVVDLAHDPNRDVVVADEIFGVQSMSWMSLTPSVNWVDSESTPTKLSVGSPTPVPGLEPFRANARSCIVRRGGPLLPEPPSSTRHPRHDVLHRRGPVGPQPGSSTRCLGGRQATAQPCNFWSDSRPTSQRFVLVVEVAAGPLHPVGVSPPSVALPARLHIAGHASQGVASDIQDSHRHLGVHLSRVGMHIDVAVGVATAVLSFPEVVCQEPSPAGLGLGT